MQVEGWGGAHDRRIEHDDDNGCADTGSMGNPINARPAVGEDVVERVDDYYIDIFRLIKGVRKRTDVARIAAEYTAQQARAAIAAIAGEGPDEARREGLRAMVAMDEELDREHPGWMTGESA